MRTKVWCETNRRLYVIEFLEKPTFDLPKWAVGREQRWGAIWHHLFAVLVDNKLLYHRIGIDLQYRPEEFIRDDLAFYLRLFARSLRHMGQEMGQHHPEGHTSRQCLLASDILETEHISLLEALLASGQSGH
ncbi:MAG: hypothetical protein ACRYFS_25305 [Janthinobacterium lividum]